MSTQRERWKGAGGNAWVELQSVTDTVMAGFIPPLLDGLSGAVLDVGCGTGATTARAAKVADRVVGLDISEAMIAAARQRDPSLEFVVADAQTHSFSEHFDHVISRFGVMFFDDPVAAFTNLRSAAKHLRVIVWRSAEENPFMTAAEEAAKSLIHIPPRETHAGQFAFGDPERVRTILEESGWMEIVLDRLDVECAMPASALETYFTRLGPTAIALQDADEATKQRVIEGVRPAFDPFVDGDTIRYTAACWLVRAGT